MGLDDILDADRHAVERPAVWPAIERLRLAQHRVPIEKGPRLDDRLTRVDPRQTGTCHLLAGDRAGRRAGGDLDSGQRVEVCHGWTFN